MSERTIRPTDLPFLSGHEPFHGLDAQVSDFWRWAFNDLRDNTTRGVLAEFIVARAVGDDRRWREGWANHDVLTPSGIRVEVKSSGRLQSWSQKRLSSPIFGRLTGRPWDPEAEVWGTAREIRADVFVFALQTCMDPSAYNVLDLDQWEFYVVPASEIERVSSRSIGLGTLRSVGAECVTVALLRDAVESARG